MVSTASGQCSSTVAREQDANNDDVIVFRKSVDVQVADRDLAANRMIGSNGNVVSIVSQATSTRYSLQFSLVKSKKIQ